MNTDIAEKKTFFTEKKHHSFRRDLSVDLASRFAEQHLSPLKRVTQRLIYLLGCETPVIFPHEKIAYLRTIKKLPALFTDSEWEEISTSHYIHELGHVCNITPDYASVISIGLEGVRAQIFEELKTAATDGVIFLDCVLQIIDAVEELADRYRLKARELGMNELADILTQVPRYPARSFHEALQFFRIIHFTLWYEGEYHNTIGRFDQYMYPYLELDLQHGILNEESALSLLEEFFISFNKDSDLYPGVQQGDNGQSLVLGGVDSQGKNSYNLLTKLCLKASEELCLIDPKINLRVSKDTPFEIYELGTQLTRKGLGFPQYSNDDIIIPGLEKLGYSTEDARNYSMAACWETIIPGEGMDIPNIAALSFPKVIDTCLHRLTKYSAMEELLIDVKKEIRTSCQEIAQSVQNLWMIPAPFMSILMHGCIHSHKDISLGCKYNNYGIHGTGIATAADSLAAIQKYVYTEKSVSARTMIDAVDKNFEGYDELLYKLRNQAPKMGQNDDQVDRLAVLLLDTFSQSVKSLRNERGGIFRAGTGSAMYYIWHANEIGASPDGRRAGEPFGANYSPSLFAKINGPVSLIYSFTKPDMVNTVNGGPLTMEFHEKLFKDHEGIQKVAKLVEIFIRRGGIQFQLNAVNKEELLDAQKHPEAHKNLIVRVWGWSAYFVELDKVYQDHIIQRSEY